MYGQDWQFVAVLLAVSLAVLVFVSIIEGGDK